MVKVRARSEILCPAGIKRIGPVKSADPHRAMIFAEQQQHARFIGLQGEKADEQNHAHQLRQHRQREQPAKKRPRVRADAAKGINKQGAAPKQPGENDVAA